MVSWAILLVFASAVPCAFSANITAEQRLLGIITSLEADNFWLGSDDMGVKHFNWTTYIKNPVYPHSPQHLSVHVHLFAKYQHWQGLARLKGFVTAETRDAADCRSLVINPTFTFKSKGPVTSYQFNMTVQVHSYWDPPAQAALVHGFEHSLLLAPNTTHEYDVLVSLSPGVKHSWSPDSSVNLIDGRGAEVPPPVLQSNSTPRDVYVIVKPLYNFLPSVYGHLLDRHIEYHQGLGVSKHILYLRRDAIPQLLMTNSRIARLTQLGRLILVQWQDMGKEHPLIGRRYEQRIIYSHAALALAGMRAVMIPMALDEYAVTVAGPYQQLSLGAMVRNCAAGPYHEARIMRFHVACKACDHLQPESKLWTNPLDPNHPLTWYHLINYRSIPAGRSATIPDSVLAYDTNQGVLAPGNNATYLPRRCLSIVHIANMVHVLHGPDTVAEQYVEEHNWMGILRRFHARPGTVKPQPKPSNATAPPAAVPAVVSATQRRLLSWDRSYLGLEDDEAWCYNQ